MHAELVIPPALPLHIRFPTRAIRSARWSSYAARTSLIAPASERASAITCVQVLSPTVLAAAISIDRCYGQQCHLPPADAMTDITQVVLLSVHQELRSEYADSLNFSSIFSAFSHIACCQGCEPVDSRRRDRRTAIF